MRDNADHYKRYPPAPKRASAATKAQVVRLCPGIDPDGLTPVAVCHAGIYDQHQEIVSYARCWQRGQVVGGERFQKELLAQLYCE